MKQVRLLIQLPWELKAKLDAERKLGVTSSGLIRRLLAKYFNRQ